MKLYWQQEDNFGDKLSPYLIEKISGIKPVFTKEGTKLLAIGSIFTHAQEGDTIWGSGLISPRHLPKSKLLNILALRGPKTQKILEEWGVKMSDNLAFGDPALLLDLFYEPQVEKEYKIGIIPHYVDQKYVKKIDEVTKKHFIDVRLPIEQFIDEVNKCEYIESSCLHGLIVADAYGIPNHHVKISDELIGGDFKFEDYYEGKKLFEPSKMINLLNSYLNKL